MYSVTALLAILAIVSALPKNFQLSTVDAANLKIFESPESNTTAPIKNNAKETSDTQHCITKDGKAGTCVSYYLCTDMRASADGCASNMDVCCSSPDTRDITDPITPDIGQLPQREGCGWRNPNGVGFRTTEDEEGKAKFGEFPWMTGILSIFVNVPINLTSSMGYVDLRIKPLNENEPDGLKIHVYIGGGSLIHPSVVLTAAHYVAASKTLMVRAGEWNTLTTKEIYPYQERDVASVEVHKDFDKYNLFYDIALLYLAREMDMAPNVGIVCLPPPRKKVSGGTQCLASGWGKDKFGKEGRYQVILKRVELPVVDRRECQSQLRKTRLEHFFELHSSFMCAGGVNGKDTCKGDGGSPLVCPIENEIDRYMQSGIVAWGIGCGEDGIPGVYVDVSNLRSWIDDKVIGKGYDPKVYTP